MEEQLSMTLARHALLCAALALTACATPQSPPVGLPQVLQQFTSESTSAPTPAPARNAQTPATTSAPSALTAMEVEQTGARTVVALAPPVDLWDRIRRGFAMPDLESDLVRDREQWYATRPDAIYRMTERSRKYLFHVVEELELRNMPTELALLPFIESAFNPQAVSVAKAAGMWQFMPATGKYFDLKQNLFRDERRDVLEST
ncbi:MAG: transglycosylase SLT domain-containing protein, partial [Rhodoferax sp.]